MAHSGISVANSPDAQIYGNIVRDNNHGIGAMEWDHPNRDAVTKCVHELRNLDVHDNEIRHKGTGAAGISSTGTAGSLAYNSWNNKFENNIYDIDDAARFRWDNSWLTYSEWKVLFPKD